MSTTDVMEEYELTQAQIEAALSYAAMLIMQQLRGTAIRFLHRSLPECVLKAICEWVL